MATPFDGLAKDILEVLLSEHGRIETESETPALNSQRADMLFVPDATHTMARRSLGLLGRMTDVVCLFEAFHDAPSIEDVVECLRKLLNHRHARSLKRVDCAERTWLLCGGRPEQALRALRAEPMPGWPLGFYDAAPALPLVIVVLSELAPDDDSLSLRLMGAGTTFERAVHDLRARFGVVARGSALFAAVVHRFLEARRRGGKLTEDPHMVDLTEAYEYMRTQWEAGHREGQREGERAATLAMLVRMTEHKLQRPLTETERAGLVQRVDRDGADPLSDAVLDLTPAALARWLCTA